MGTRKQHNPIRPWLLRMQAVVAARQCAAACLPPIMAALMDVRLRIIGARIVDEMRRIEGSAAA